MPRKVRCRSKHRHLCQRRHLQGNQHQHRYQHPKKWLLCDSNPRFGDHSRHDDHARGIKLTSYFPSTHSRGRFFVCRISTGFDLFWVFADMIRHSIDPRGFSCGTPLSQRRSFCGRNAKNQSAVRSVSQTEPNLDAGFP